METPSLREGRLLLSKNIPNILDMQNHICGPVALHIMFPEIFENKILEAFYNCTEEWPREGVSNKEFNIIISFLKLKSRVRYCGNDTTIKNLLLSNKFFIALVDRHFVVVSGGKVLDFFDTYWGSHINEKVYCYWEWLG